MRPAQIGSALAALVDDVKANTADLVRQYRAVDAPAMVKARHEIALLKQAVDTPHRARAQVAAWVAGYNGRNGAGKAAEFLNACLAAAGSSATIAQIDAELAALEAQALVIVGRVNNDGWTWEQVAGAIESQFQRATSEHFDYSRLPLPAGYTDVWGGKRS